MRWTLRALWWLNLLVGVACDRPSSSSPPSPSAPIAVAPERHDDAATATVPSDATDSRLVERDPATQVVATFDGDVVGAASPAFEAVVGDWYVTEEAGARALKVAGGKWRSGQPSVSIADQAKRLYGERYAEFLDGVKAFAFFPLAIWTGDRPPGDVRISVRFYAEAGKVDQAAGIAFAVAPDGSYLGARANALEDNILFFRVVKGKRAIIDTIRNVPTPSKTWHTFTVELRGRRVAIDLDGRRHFEKALDRDPVGKLGLWSKADSQVLFDDFAVTSLQQNEAP